MTKRQLEIHGQNILPIIKRWLYSDKDIFVRELISNACDAISKRKLLAEKNETTSLEPRIDLKINASQKQITIEDNGLGMDESELVRYLSQVAFSSAEEFMTHYAGSSKEEIIGHFGLGFYSAFMVASKVEVESLSYKEGAEAKLWSCEGGTEYSIEPSERSSIGTKLILTLSDEALEYLDASKIEAILKRYTRFLPYPIYFNDKLLGQKDPLWLKAPKDCQDADYLSFYHELYPTKADPLFWIHLDVDYPFRLKGILYFPSKEELRESTDAIGLYSNRVFVSEGCRDILPAYLLPLHGAMDSPDIPLNVSRSSLQLDTNVRQLASHISKKVADKLKEISKESKEKFEAVFSDIELIIKWGALSDEKFFERIEPLIIWKNDRGDWTNLQEYLKRAENSHTKKVFYGYASQMQAPCMKLYRSKQIEVLQANEMIDPSYFSKLEEKHSIEFCRIDASLDKALVDESKTSDLLDEHGQTQATRLEKLFGRLLEKEQTSIEAKSLHSHELPALVTVDEKERRFYDYMVRKSGSCPFTPKESIILNTSHPLISVIERLEAKEPELAKKVACEIVDLAKLSQSSSVDEDQKQKVADRTWSLLEELVQKIL